MNWRERPREQQAVIYVVGMLDRIVDSGVLGGGRYRLSETAKAAFREMELDGFTVSPDEIHRIMRVLETE